MAKNTKVFIAGSRGLSRLSGEVLRRLDNIVEKRLTVLIGDANGVDKAVQNYLYGKHYGEVVVFCMEGKCRNNIGNWPINSIGAVEPSRRDFAYFSTKDRAMVRECNYGLMLWNGLSRGTLTSIINLVKQEKPAVVYVAGNRRFFTLRDSDCLTNMLKQVAPSALQNAEGELRTLTVTGSSSHGPNRAQLF